MDFSSLFDVPSNSVADNDVLDLSKLSVTSHVVEHEAEIPEYQGDYAQVVFLWSHSKGRHKMGEDSFPAYIIYECGIAAPNKYQQKMLTEGFLEEDSMDSAMESLSGERLKEIAAELGVATSGKKSKIVERILGAASMDDLHSICPKTCSLTEKGKKFVDDHNDYVQIHRHKTFGIDWKEYDSFKAREPQLGFCDIVERMLIERASVDERFLGAAQYLFLSELLYEYDRPHKATLYLLQRMYLEANGVAKWHWFRDYVEKGYGDKKLLLDNYYFGEFFNTNEAEKLKLHGEFYNTDIVDKLYSWKLPVQLCDKVLFEQMIESVLDDCFEKEKFEPVLHSHYIRYVDSLRGKHE